MNTQELMQDVRALTKLNERNLTDSRIIRELNNSYFLLLEKIKQIYSYSKISGDSGEYYETITINDANILSYPKNDKGNQVLKVKFKESGSDEWICLKKGERCGDSICSNGLNFDILWIDNEEDIIFSEELRTGEMQLHMRSGKITTEFDINNLNWVNKLPLFSHPVLSAYVAMKVLPDKKTNLHFIAENQYNEFYNALKKHFSKNRKRISKIKLNTK